MAAAYLRGRPEATLRCVTRRGAVLLDVTGEESDPWATLFPYYGHPDDGAPQDMAYRLGANYPYLVVESNRDALVPAGFTHVIYRDDYPEGAVTVQRIAPGADQVTPLRAPRTRLSLSR